MYRPVKLRGIGVATDTYDIPATGMYGGEYSTNYAPIQTPSSSVTSILNPITNWVSTNSTAVILGLIGFMLLRGRR